MQGLMQDFPLTLTHLFDRAERLFPDKGIVTYLPAGPQRVTYGEWADRTRRLGTVLDTLGISEDGRVGTFCWNTSRHLELYFAAPCTGRVCHTLNLRLFPEQITYIVNHAEDEVLFIDKTVAGLIWPLLGTFTSVRHLVVIDDGGPFDTSAGVPDGVELHDYEELLAAAAPREWPVLDDENLAAAMCYTSGTTGNPKGVVYSHRSSVLHSFGAMFADGFGANERDVVLPVVPMFHANAWGLTHAAVACGATLVMPGPNMAPAALAGMIEAERVTVAAGVPTIWMGLLPELAGKDTSSLRAVACGGSAVPTALSEAFREQIGLPIYQAWGMTETSPVATVGNLRTGLDGAPEAERAKFRAMQGTPILGVELRIADQTTGEVLPWDGESQGELQARGPWIAREYYDDERSPESFTSDGWLKTGDVAVFTPDGYLKLVDRTKDVVKSGGEWISSVELENEIMGHPKVAEAAVVGMRHPKWQERPVAFVVVAEGQELDMAEVIEFLDGRVAKWWLPDDVVFVDTIPKTSVGKFSKKDLRDQFKDYTIPGADEA
jgi:fatty-acyl-CoA synthase